MHTWQNGATIAITIINTYMPDKNIDIVPNSGFKADNFDKEKEEAKKIEQEKKQADDNENAAKEQEILKQQKETD